jgi:hypothetical protein
VSTSTRSFPSRGGESIALARRRATDATVPIDRKTNPPAVARASKLYPELRSLTVAPLSSLHRQAAGVAAVAKPSLAAYGDSANIWGATTNTSGASSPVVRVALGASEC